MAAFPPSADISKSSARLPACDFKVGGELRISRRQLMLAGTVSTAGGLLRQPALGQQSDATGDIQRITLDCGWHDTTLDGKAVRLRAYNEQVPGPVIETRPGQTLDITLRNNLTAFDSSDWDKARENVPHELNTTNLHLHGLEIVPHLFDPVGTSDPKAKMIAIEPEGGRYRYEFQIAEDQPPGLFWYHPHKHGSTAVQAVSGMAGAIIVRGDIDLVPEIRDAREFVLAISDIGLFPSDDSADGDLWLYEPKQNAIWDTTTGEVRKGTWDDPDPTELNGGFTTGDYKLRYFMVNGAPFFREKHNFDDPRKPDAEQLDVPRYTLRPGEVVRFRMLNATSDNLMPIVVKDHDVHLIALDGVNFPAPRSVPGVPIDATDSDGQVLLAPANRAEFLIKASEQPGIYPIRQLEQSRQFLHSAAKKIAEIEVAGTGVDMKLPTELPLPSRHYPLIAPSEITGFQSVVFKSVFHGEENKRVGIDFLVGDEFNQTLYQEGIVDPQFVVKRGDAEEWTLSVAGRSESEGHPFHIHVNAFEVVSIGGQPQESGTIQDTVWVEPGRDVVIRMKYRQWTGKSVFHCHILPHEDTGMMKNFLIEE